MKIGIGVCSCRRPVMATDVCQKIHYETQGVNHECTTVCSVDDDSIAGYEGLTNFGLIHGPNKGVGYNKNRILSYLKDNDVIFIIEDDLVIKTPGWINFYMSALADTGWQHLNYLVEGWEGHYQHAINRTQDFGKTKIGFGTTEFNGVFMVMTSKCIAAIGGFDVSFGKYGCEHTDYSIRAAAAGMCPKESTHVMGSEKFLKWEHTTSVIPEIDKSAFIKEAQSHFTWDVKPPLFRDYKAEYKVV